MGAEETRAVHGQHVHDPVLMLVWSGTSPSTVALPGPGATGLFPVAAGGYRPQDAVQLHPTWERIPGLGIPRAGLSITPAAAWDHGPAPALAMLPVCRAGAASLPCQRARRTVRCAARAKPACPSSGGPLELRCSYWGYFICTLQ